MREIKFRVWDELNKCYDGCYLPGFNGEILEFDKDGTYKNVQNGNKIVEQYTGLKDKNGIEIYEGDIIEMFKELFVVYFDTKKAGFYTKKYNSCELFTQRVLSCYRSKDAKIISNIHEVK